VKQSMRAARLHKIGAEFQIDEIPVPKPGPKDVLVRVRVAGIVPNLRNVITYFPDWFPYLPLPPLPAIYGLDAAGEVAAVGEQVHSGVKPGDRVYVNPGLSCGTCAACRHGDTMNCESYTFSGYFGFGEGSHKLYKDYPYGGFGEYMTAPAANIVKITDDISFEQAARFGYIGTAFAALRKADFKAGQTVLIDGGTGTLGLGGVISALAMGASKVFATGRNKETLEKLGKIDPLRIRPIALGERLTSEILKEETDGLGVDVMIQCLGANAPAATVVDSFKGLRRGGKAVNVGGVSETLPIDPFPLMCFQKQLIGSNWFSTAEAEEMVALAKAGLLNLGVFEHERFSLNDVNVALATAEKRASGFSNVVVVHD
jgi:D-arabinose 1-dehydrogenase-like Zn-dependent alcohol dehydrogenase